MHVPISPRSIALMLVATAAAGWFESVTTPNAPTTDPRQSPRGAVSRPAEDTAMPSTERLRERMSAPALPTKGRNPFVYGSRTTARPQNAEAANVASPAAIDVPPPAAAPMFRLSGIASNTENGATVLTAILIDNGTMVFVKTGDTLSNGYSVTRVEEMSITIADATGVTQTIKLP